MKFDSIENLLKYANATICVVEHKSLPNGAVVGMITNNYGHAGWPQGEKVCVLTHDKELYPINRAKEWEISSPQNGYVKQEGANKLFYLERDPKRIWKVGICSGNSSPKDFWQLSPTYFSSIKAIHDLQTKNFEIYSLDDPRLTGKNAMILSAKYAVIQTRLFYRGDAIANIDFKNKRLLFTDYCNRSTMEYHLRNLSSRMGGFAPVFFEIKKETVNLREYNYELDI